MSTWDVIVSHEAAKTLRRLDSRQRKRLQKEIYGLAESPYPAPGRDIIPVKGVPDLLRLRVGDWRIFYTINDTENTVYVAAIRPRGGAYRRL
ncbi:MAG: type II toxin-antitoxin system RelE/ParE family toxin [Syntrophothermus sp.]|uniref:type II toxin-antitoxin system RelE family toxin n=1 Tax=Syntrophothermus sp. TaxID=2736299 RepID=UPI00257CF706|nr:type II toxin-antitoxin system RelE/ParE family toxin [Syntrophothermus sp.]NSW83183.1 type II toxin-antitoxin system RelE/ParE family toxin [Syntrophothermus sp.]